MSQRTHKGGHTTRRILWAAAFLALVIAAGASTQRSSGAQASSRGASAAHASAGPLEHSPRDAHKPRAAAPAGVGGAQLEREIQALRARHEQAAAQTQEAIMARRAALDGGDAVAAAEALESVLELVQQRLEMARELSALASERVHLHGR